MKKNSTLFIFIAVLLFGACSNSGNSFSDSLSGKYHVDLSQAKDIIEDELKVEKIPSQMLSLVLGQLNLTAEFEGNSLEVNTSESVANLLGSFTKYSLPMRFEYKIESDSLIYIKEDGGEFKKVGTLKKNGDSYDNLKFVPNSNKFNVEVVLQRDK